MEEIEARYYSQFFNKLVQCSLCPHACVILPEKSGICKVRTNRDGKLIASTYGNISALNLDPVEKKPLYHFYPGRKILSLGSIGCNMHCTCCQNYSISQIGVNEMLRLIHETNADLIKLAKKQPSNIGLAFTYNEPTVWFEYMFDLAKLAKEHDLLCVLVSNAFIERQPLTDLLEYIDACNIDIKASNDETYRGFTGASMSHVLENLITIRKKNVFLELTYLLIPGINDNLQDFKGLLKWIHCELGEETILHISRYFPRYNLNTPSTSMDLLNAFREAAGEVLKYVYLGNVEEKRSVDTFCPDCGTKIILRTGYSSQIINLSDNGRCLNCNRTIPILK